MKTQILTEWDKQKLQERLNELFDGMNESQMIEYREKAALIMSEKLGMMSLLINKYIDKAIENMKIPANATKKSNNRKT